MQRELERRPLVVLLCALIVGLTAVANPLNLAFLVGALSYLRSLRSWTILAVGLVVGLVLTPAPVVPIKSASYVWGTARIESGPIFRNDVWAADADVNGQKLRLFLSQEAHYGETWRVEGVARPPSEMSSGPGTLQARHAERVISGPWLFVLADEWRDGFDRLTHRVLDRDGAEWIDMLCFRDGNLSSQDREDIERAGESYLVSASGLHVYVLAGLICWLLAALRLPRVAQILGCLAVLSLYCLATGLHVSTLRAAVACMLFMSAYLARREADALSALGLAGCAFLLLFPDSAESLGFQLSVLVVAALALFLPRPGPLEPTAKGTLLRWLRSGAWATAIIVLAGEPLLAFYTGEVSIATIPSNLLTAVVAPVAIGLCFVAYVASFVSLSVAAGLLAFAAPLVSFVRDVAHWSAGMGLSVTAPAFSAYWLAVYYGLWIVTWRPRPTVV